MSRVVFVCCSYDVLKDLCATGKKMKCGCCVEVRMRAQTVTPCCISPLPLLSFLPCSRYFLLLRLSARSSGVQKRWPTFTCHCTPSYTWCWRHTAARYQSWRQTWMRWTTTSFSEHCYSVDLLVFNYPVPFSWDVYTIYFQPVLPMSRAVRFGTGIVRCGNFAGRSVVCATSCTTWSMCMMQNNQLVKYGYETQSDISSIWKRMNILLV